jgi:hypothetical protein
MKLSVVQKGRFLYVQKRGGLFSPNKYLTYGGYWEPWEDEYVRPFESLKDCLTAINNLKRQRSPEPTEHVWPKIP